MIESEPEIEEDQYYKIVTSDEFMSQGDFVQDLPIVIPKKEILNNHSGEKSSYPVFIQVNDVIILTHTCDLIEEGNRDRKVDTVIVCPYMLLSDYKELCGDWRNDKPNLISSRIFNKCLLPKCNIEGYPNDHFVVDFREIYSVPYDVLLEYTKSIENRLRLQSPFREYLSQSFGRFFMRVALPEGAFDDLK